MNRTILALGLYLLAGSVRADVTIVGTPEHITANASIDEGVVIPTGANACTIEVVGHTANDGPIVGYLNFDDATDIIFTHVATASFAAQGLVSVYYIADSGDARPAFRSKAGQHSIHAGPV